MKPKCKDVYSSDIKIPHLLSDAFKQKIIVTQPKTLSFHIAKMILTISDEYMHLSN